MRLDQLADIIGASLHAPTHAPTDAPTKAQPSGGSDHEATEIERVAAIEHAKAGDITFISRPEYLPHLATTKASAVILREPLADCPIPQLIHKNPQLAYAKASLKFYAVDYGAPRISPAAVIADSAQLGDDVIVHPYAVIEADAVVGAGAVIFPHVFLGKGVRIGKGAVIHANTVIYEGCEIGAEVIVHAGTVIGGDGFGYVPDERGELVKIPQVGNVVIEEQVEIGPLCTIDRGALGSTTIGRNTKLDSKVHVGHNVVIGANSVFSAHTAIAGSAKVGSHVMCGGHAGIAGHLEVCDQVKIGAMTGVIKPITEPGTYLGFPAVDATTFHRRQVHFKRMGDQAKKIKSLEARLAQLERALKSKSS